MTSFNRILLICAISAAQVACGPSVQYTPEDPTHVLIPRPVEDVTLVEEGQTPGPGYRTVGTVTISSEVSCNTAMSQNKEGAKKIVDEYVKNHMEDYSDATAQEVVEAMAENGDLDKNDACKVLPIFGQIPEKEDVIIAVLKGSNMKALLNGTADAGGDGLWDVNHEIFKTRKKPALSGAGAVSPSLVVNVKSKGKVIKLKKEKKKEKKEKAKEKEEEVVVVAKAEPPDEEAEEAAEEPGEEPEGEPEEEPPAKTKGKKKETLVVKTEVVESAKPKKEEKKKKKEPPKVDPSEPWPPPDEFEGMDEYEKAKAQAEAAEKAASEAAAEVKEAKMKAKEAKLLAEKAAQAKKKAAMAKKKAEMEAKLKSEKEAKKAKLEAKKKTEEEAKKKAAEEEAKKKAEEEAAAKAAAKKKAEEEAKKKAEEEAKKEEEVELKKADKDTINKAKNIIRGWKKEVFVCLHKSDILESEGKVKLTFFITTDGRLDAMSITPQPESDIKDCLLKTLGDLDFPEVGATYDFAMKYKVTSE